MLLHELDTPVSSTLKPSMPASLKDDSAIRSPDLYCNEAALSDNSSSLDFEFPGDCDDHEGDSSIDNMFRMELEQMQRLDVDRELPRDDEFESARRNAVRWMLQVHRYYNFRGETGYLALNYLNRFLSSHHFPEEWERWAWQLASVACLSLAAKMEETAVPSLMDLQIWKPEFVFTPKTIQRMELLIMAGLKWRLRIITPFDFLHHYAAKAPIPNTHSTQLISNTSDVILRACQDPEFWQYSPSTIAVAALLFTTGQNADDERLSKEMVKRCYSFLQKHFEKISDSSESNVRDDKGSDDSDECCGGKFQCLVRHDKEFQRKKRTCTPYRPNND